MTVLQRTIAWLSTIVLIWFAVLSAITLQVRGQVRDDALSTLKNAVHHKTAMVEQYIASQKNSLEEVTCFFRFAASQYPIFEPSFWASERLERQLLSREKYNGFYDVFLISIEGDVVHALKKESDFQTNLNTGPYRNSELSRVFKDALKNGDPALSEFRYYPPSRDYAAFLAKPVLIEGKIAGVVAAQIDNKAIHKVINDYRELGQSAEVVAAVFREGRWIAMAPTRHSKNIPYHPLKNTEHLPAYDISGERSGSDYAFISGETIALAWDEIRELGWIVTITMDEDELLEEWYHLITWIGILFLGGVFMIGVLIEMAFRSFNDPINELTGTAMRIAEGDYDVDIDPSTFYYEFQILSHAFKQMLSEIRQKIAKSAEYNRLLQRQKEEIEDLNKNLEVRVRISTKQLQKYIDIVDRYVITSQTDTSGTITSISDAFCRVSGYTKNELIGKTHAITRHPDMKKTLFKQMWATIKGGHTWHKEIKNKKADGGDYWVDTTISPMIENGVMVGYLSIGHDITNQKRIEEMSITDSMTGLYNRRYYTKTVQKELNRAKRNRYTVALMMIDVDHFKLYNDTYGHQEGDKVLVQIAAVLRRYTSREGEYGFRMGGEEFAVLMIHMGTAEYLDSAERLRRDVERLNIPHGESETAPCVTISLGIAVWTPDEIPSEEELYKRADTHLYLAKAGGRNRVAGVDV